MLHHPGDLLLIAVSDSSSGEIISNMKNVRVVCFDLDDTLWDLRPVIPRAEKKLYEWFAANCPRVVECYTQEDIGELRVAATEKWPELGHDLTELRLRVLREIAEAADYDEEMVSSAFDVFITARNDVEVYADVVPVLEQLAQSYKLVAMSNGNADLERIGLAGYFSATYTAREMGVAKPDHQFFNEASLRCGVSAAEMLHIGDHPLNDVVTPQRVGMYAIWLNRNEQEWPQEYGMPDHKITGLHELLSLLR